jgi:hypothetical protein
MGRKVSGYENPRRREKKDTRLPKRKKRRKQQAQLRIQKAERNTRES